MGASRIALQHSFTNCKLIRDIAPEWDMWKSGKKSTKVEAGRLSVTLTLPNLFMFSEISFTERQNENYITQFFRSEENSTRLFSIYCPSANVDQLPPNICKRKYTRQRVKENYKILEFEVSLMISSWLLMHFFIHSFLTHSFNKCYWSPPTSWALQLPRDKRLTHPVEKVTVQWKTGARRQTFSPVSSVTEQDPVQKGMSEFLCYQVHCQVWGRWVRVSISLQTANNSGLSGNEDSQSMRKLNGERVQ